MPLRGEVVEVCVPVLIRKCSRIPPSRLARMFFYAKKNRAPVKELGVINRQNVTGFGLERNISLVIQLFGAEAVFIDFNRYR